MDNLAIILLIAFVVVAAVVLVRRKGRDSTGTDSNGGSTRPGADQK